MAIEHSDIPNAELHELKGASTAASGQVPTSDGAGGIVWKAPPLAGSAMQGVYDYNDVTTASTPISLAVAGTQYELTNDGAGAFTNVAYPIPGLANMWDVATNRFIFKDGTVLALGDTVDIRFDVEVTTSTTNTAIDLVIELGIGGSPYQLSIINEADKKAAGTYKLIRWFGIYMGDSNTLDNPGRVLAAADKTGVTVKVNGWYIRALSTLT